MPWKTVPYDADGESAREAANPPIAQVTVTLYSLKPGDSEVGVSPSFSGPFDSRNDPEHVQLLAAVQRELQAGLVRLDGMSDSG
jgi:hypothetical protein